jgi:hypothetical protein
MPVVAAPAQGVAGARATKVRRRLCRARSRPAYCPLALEARAASERACESGGKLFSFPSLSLTKNVLPRQRLLEPRRLAPSRRHPPRYWLTLSTLSTLDLTHTPNHPTARARKPRRRRWRHGRKRGVSSGEAAAASPPDGGSLGGQRRQQQQWWALASLSRGVGCGGCRCPLVFIDAPAHPSRRQQHRRLFAGAAAPRALGRWRCHDDGRPQQTPPPLLPPIPSPLPAAPRRPRRPRRPARPPAGRLRPWRPPRRAQAGAGGRRRRHEGGGERRHVDGPLVARRESRVL